MSALDPRELRAIFGRLMIQMSLVWAATMLGAAIAAKASDEFTVSRSAGGRDAVDVADSRPRLGRAFGRPFTAAR